MTTSTSTSPAWEPPAPSRIPSLPAAALEPVLQRLLESPAALSAKLAQQSFDAIASLAPPPSGGGEEGEGEDDERPVTFEGLLDVARYCVDDEPGWTTDEKVQLVGGHPKIGAPLVPPAPEASGSSISEESRKEQLSGGEADSDTLDRECPLAVSARLESLGIGIGFGRSLTNSLAPPLTLPSPD